MPHACSLVRLLGLVGCLACAAATPADAETLTADSGLVHAELSYRARPDFGYEDFRITIARGDQTLVQTTVPDTVGGEFPGTTPLYVRDLDLDGEPEVAVDIYSGGAHCCTYSVVYRYDAVQEQYSLVVHDWQSTGYRLTDFESDGVPEFDSLDNDFAYVFTSYAGSVFPPQRWRFQGGQFVDVTREYPARIAKQAARLAPRRAIRTDPGGLAKTRLAAYLADRYLLGEGPGGWRQIRSAYQGRDRAGYFRKLRRILRRAGYL